MALFGGKYRSPTAWSTEPLPAPPHPAVTPLENVYWRCTALAWNSERFHDIVRAWLADPTHLHALLTARPDWCESARACDVAVANLFDQCINYRPCACVASPAAGRVTYIAHAVETPRRQRRVESLPLKEFAAEAMRVLAPHVFRACRALIPVRVPMEVFGVQGVWIGPSAPAIEARETPIVASWGLDVTVDLHAAAEEVVRDLEAPVSGASWLDVLCGHEAPTDARRVAKVARADIIRALQRRPVLTQRTFFEDIV